jgi:hypothetical protein
MTVSLGLINRQTGEFRDVPVSTSDSFRKRWLPAAQALGLELVPHLHDGTFTVLAKEDIPKILEELRRLREYVVVKPELASIAERIDNIVATFRSTDPAEWEYDFG